jgi:hypothetical protein
MAFMFLRETTDIQNVRNFIVWPPVGVHFFYRYARKCISIKPPRVELTVHRYGSHRFSTQPVCLTSKPYRRCVFD